MKVQNVSGFSNAHAEEYGLNLMRLSPQSETRSSFDIAKPLV